MKSEANSLYIKILEKKKGMGMGDKGMMGSLLDTA